MNEDAKDPDPEIYNFESLNKYQDNRPIAKASRKACVDMKMNFINSNQKTQGFIDENGRLVPSIINGRHA